MFLLTYECRSMIKHEIPFLDASVNLIACTDSLWYLSSNNAESLILYIRAILKKIIALHFYDEFASNINQVIDILTALQTFMRERLNYVRGENFDEISFKSDSTFIDFPDNLAKWWPRLAYILKVSIWRRIERFFALIKKLLTHEKRSSNIWNRLSHHFFN